jgi:hypothetical protein
MSVEILVNVTLLESRVAVVEQGVTQELYVERARSSIGTAWRRRSIVRSIVRCRSNPAVA